MIALAELKGGRGLKRYAKDVNPGRPWKCLMQKGGSLRQHPGLISCCKMRMS